MALRLNLALLCLAYSSASGLDLDLACPDMEGTFLGDGVCLNSTYNAAQRPSPADGSPINTSHYRVDLSRGVVVSSSRVVGLSGAATSPGPSAGEDPSSQPIHATAGSTQRSNSTRVRSRMVTNSRASLG